MTLRQDAFREGFADFDKQWAHLDDDFALHAALAGDAWWPPLTGGVRHPDDPADSLYRAAREMLNRGDWRKAATLLRELPQKYPNSSYAPDALYWQAFALYRIGGSADLREALELLQTLQQKYPGARTQPDPALATRIRGALAARGDPAARGQISAAAGDTTLACDREDQAVRSEALSALMQADPEGASQAIQKVLARRDACSVPLRRNAVFLIGSKRRDTDAIALLSQVARTDTAVEVRGAAIDWLSRVPSEEVLPLLDDLARNSDDERIQRAAIRALVSHPSARARQMVRAFVDRNDSPERLRLEAISAFDKERSTSEDVTWLRGLYARTDSPRIKQRVVSTLSRIGGTEVDQFLLSVVRNTDESSDTRGLALRRVAQSMPIGDLAKLYDGASEQNVREALIGTMAQRPEPEATDKLIDIVKNGTDPQLRRQAISALTRKKDPRTVRLLMEIIDK